MIEFASDTWKKAIGALKAARFVVEIDADSSASRAYYAAFHAITTLFASEGISFKKHSALQAAVHRDLVNTGKWPADGGKAFDNLRDLRQMGDYESHTSVSRDEAETAIGMAQSILDMVQKANPNLFTSSFQ